MEDEDLESKLDVVECDDEEEDLLFGNLTPRDKLEALDRYLMGLSKRFMKYRLNVFLLNRVSNSSLAKCSRLPSRSSTGSSGHAGPENRWSSREA